MNFDVCPICNNKTVKRSGPVHLFWMIDCGFCGNYQLFDPVAFALSNRKLTFTSVERAALSCYIRRSYKTTLVEVNWDVVKKFQSDSRYNQMNHIPGLIRYIGDYVSEKGTPVPQMAGVNVQRIICAPSMEIVEQIMEELFEQKVIVFQDVR